MHGIEQAGAAWEQVSVNCDICGVGIVRGELYRMRESEFKVCTICRMRIMTAEPMRVDESCACGDMSEWTCKVSNEPPNKRPARCVRMV